MPGPGDRFINLALSKCLDHPSAEPFAAVLPQWRQIDKSVSDSHFHRKQLQLEFEWAAELTQAMMKIQERRTDRAAGVTSAGRVISTQSVAALQNFLQDVPISSRTLAFRPAVGQTKDWNSQSEYRPTRKINRGTLQSCDVRDVQMGSTGNRLKIRGGRLLNRSAAADPSGFVEGAA
jgi:hypothetical protein